MRRGKNFARIKLCSPLTLFGIVDCLFSGWPNWLQARKAVGRYVVAWHSVPIIIFFECRSIVSVHTPLTRPFKLRDQPY